ncbi:hypothetical protein BaRGS_00003438 [Batillaria attramentaria]|uniref:Mitochondrial import inner membrane translocase subunit Tim21 n=1 Tax=Batillaria attramentaria TaxID=370345 RepID=A0ABD0M1V4_9CAEN
MNIWMQGRNLALCKDVFRLKQISLHAKCCHKLSSSQGYENARALQLHVAYLPNLHSGKRKLGTEPFSDPNVLRQQLYTISFVPTRSKSTGKQSSDTSEKRSLVEARESPYAGLTPSQKVKEAGKDASYTLVIVVGLAVTGFMFYMIGRELFSSQSPSGVYGDALKKCQASMEVTAALGEPIKGYGETTRRGRRRHVSHTEFEVNGVPHMRMRFYVEGPYRKATVHVEVEKGESGKYEYRYLFVETEGYPHRTFILEDNR